MTGTKGGGDVKRLAHAYMAKLLDRDTEAMAAAQLDAMARSLPAHSLPSFISAISDTRPNDKTPLRRHCVRLLSVLALTHPHSSLAPLLPRMLSAVLRRLRDPDSSVRSACVDAVRSMAATSSSPASTFLRPLSEALLLEQDPQAQTGSALCLAAAVEALDSGPPDPDRRLQLQRLLPRLVKLARTDAFRAKPALLGLLGAAATASGGTATAVPCLVEFLNSEDWAARKAAADALCRVASQQDATSLTGFRAGCLASGEACRFDKVKTVRESMNQMMEAWREIPDAGGGGNGAATKEGSYSKDVNGDGHMAKGNKNSNLTRTNSQLSAAKSRYSSGRSPPRESSLVPLLQRNTPLSEKKPSPPLFRKLDRNKKDSDWTSETDIPCEDSSKTAHGDARQRNVTDERLLTGLNRSQFGKSFKDEVKSDYSKGGTNVVLFNEKETFSSFTGFIMDEACKNDMESDDLCLIRRQLVQIENQQSGLIDLLQKFIGSSQNGMHALEKRVQGLEMVLDELSHEMSMPTGRTANADLRANGCCLLPGAEFLSSKFWRKTEGRYSSRFSVSSSQVLDGIRNPAEKTNNLDSFNWDKHQYGIRSGFLVNPLAGANSCSRDNSEVGSERMLKKAGYVPGSVLLHDAKGFDGASTSSCSSRAGILNR